MQVSVSGGGGNVLNSSAGHVQSSWTSGVFRQRDDDDALHAAIIAMSSVDPDWHRGQSDSDNRVGSSEA